MSKALAGLVAGVPLAVALGLYMLVRGQALVAMLMADGDMGALSDGQARALFTGLFALMGLVFGVLSGVLYGRLENRQLFLGVMLGLAAVLSLLALATRTPMAADKVVMNFLVAATLGGLVPLLGRS